MLSKKNKTSFVQEARAMLAHRQRLGDWSVRDWKSLIDCQILHTALGADILDFLSYEDFATAWTELITLHPIQYLELFDRLQSVLLMNSRSGGTAKTLVVALEGILEIAPIKGLILKIAEEIFPSSLPTMDNESLFFRIVYQLSAFPLRLDLPSRTKADFGHFLDINSKRTCYTPAQGLIDLAKELIDDKFCNNMLQQFHPHHGPGAVSFLTDKGRLSSARLRACEKDRRLDLNEVNYFVEIMHREHPLRQEFFDPRTKTPVRVISVPKSWKKRRIIAIESATAMYLQEGLKNGLYHAISKSFFGRFVDFERPELNGVFAQIGSLYGTFSTIDLSAASDSVGYRFVECLLSGTPIWKYIKKFRSETFNISEDVYASNIFATMGNAICFPIETLIFAILTEYARRQVGCPQPFRVYGDDIVASTETADFLLPFLEDNGFTVNQDKTFHGSSCPFRESCGFEWYLGDDVSPLRISRKFTGLPTRRDLEQVIGLVSLANSAYEKGFKTLYRMIVDHISMLDIHLPFSEDGSIGFISDHSGQCNTDFPTRWGKLHYTELEADAIEVRTNTYLRSGEIAYGEYLLSTRCREADLMCQPLGPDWVPATAVGVPRITSTASSAEGLSVRKCFYTLWQ